MAKKEEAACGEGYLKTQMKKEKIIELLKERGCRITKQRRMLLDIILEEECSCCKEIYYKAVKIDKNIGTATVYRMINVLEEIGAISRKNMYKISCGEACEVEEACSVELSDHTVCHLSGKKWNRVLQEGLRACGYIKQQEIMRITVRTCECEE
ncbi:MAG: transcriptional repressor [Lachnospiraceae bacterium]